MTADRDANLPAWHPQLLRLHFQTIPIEADGSALFDTLFAGSHNAVWLDSPGASTSVLCDDSYRLPTHFYRRQHHGRF